jgi:hypothetical protein
MALPVLKALHEKDGLHRWLKSRYAYQLFGTLLLASCTPDGSSHRLR